MAVAGIVAAQLSHSDALLVDGLYSGENFVSAIVAARISIAVLQPATARYPFGFDAHEALYVSFRSLVLIGVITFAVFVALEKIVYHFSGGAVPELVMGPIVIYSLLMFVICIGLGILHHHAWRKSGRNSEILQTEAQAAFIDGGISLGAGIGLFGSGYLVGTSLEPIVPIADSLMVLIMAAVIIGAPVRLFRKALREVSGKAADPQVSQQVRTITEQAISDKSFDILHVIVTKLGRIYSVIPCLKPHEVISAAEVDELRDLLIQKYQPVLGHVRTEILITARYPYSKTVDLDENA